MITHISFVDFSFVQEIKSSQQKKMENKFTYIKVLIHVHCVEIWLVLSCSLWKNNSISSLNILLKHIEIIYTIYMC